MATKRPSKHMRRRVDLHVPLHAEIRATIKNEVAAQRLLHREREMESMRIYVEGLVSKSAGPPTSSLFENAGVPKCACCDKHRAPRSLSPRGFCVECLTHELASLARGIFKTSTTV
jgi:hypothetical protein